MTKSSVLGVASPASQAVLGAVLVARPRRVLAAVGEASPDEPALLGTRVLGGRHLIEAVALAVRPAPGVALAGACVDTIHAASMAALAFANSRHRRLAMISGAGAVAFAAADLARAGALSAHR